MKIRNGFVSNSSTSSFCIYGVELDYDTLKEIRKKVGGDEDDSNYYEMLETLLENVDNLRYRCVPDDNYFIGRTWTSIGDNETGKQFKDSVENGIEKLLGKKMKCETYEEAYND